MMQYRRIGISLAAAAVAEIFNKLVPFILLRLAMQRLGIEAFGASQYLLWVADILCFVVVFGFPQFTAIQLGQTSFPSENANRIITAQLCGRLFLAAMTGSALWIWSEFSQTSDFSLIGWLVIGLAIFFSAIDMYPVQVARSRLASFSMASIMAKMTSIIAVWYWVTDGSDAELFALCSVIANGIVSLISIYVASQEASLTRISFDDFWKQLKGAAKFAPTIILLICLERFDFFFVEKFFDPVIVGSYAAAGRLVQSAVPVIYSISHIFLAELVQNRSNEAQRAHLNMCIEVLALLTSTIIAACVILSGPILQLVYGTTQEIAATILPILSLSLAMHAIYVVFGVLVLPLRGGIGFVGSALGSALACGLLVVWFNYPMTNPETLAWTNSICRGIAALLCLIAARDALNRGSILAVLRGISPALAGWLASKSVSGSAIISAILFTLTAIIIAVLIQRTRITKLIAKLKANRSAT
jgi:O-antigen/teichoic acid export membrane protein